MKKIFDDIIKNMMAVPLVDKPKEGHGAHGPTVHITIAHGTQATDGPQDEEPGEVEPDADDLAPGNPQHDKLMKTLHAKGKKH